MPNPSDFNVIRSKGSSDFTVVLLKTDFEIRCEKSKEILLNWTRLQNISADDEDRKEERTQYENKIFALLSDPMQIGIDSLLADGSKQEDFIKIVRAMYGDDAVNFVLQVR
ncbi:hypothetical protein HYT04_00570 [Candidatus Kaiserbacteria bacterium]|nr:hypothetical protein [Candidatus Kaiserbacteria bacterium]